MKLYEAPKYSVIKLADGTVLDFHHIDGAYSYCTDSEGRPHHIQAWADVEVLGPYEEQQRCPLNNAIPNMGTNIPE